MIASSLTDNPRCNRFRPLRCKRFGIEARPPNYPSASVSSGDCSAGYSPPKLDRSLMIRCDSRQSRLRAFDNERRTKGVQWNSVPFAAGNFSVVLGKHPDELRILWLPVFTRPCCRWIERTHKQQARTAVLCWNYGADSDLHVIYAAGQRLASLALRTDAAHGALFCGEVQVFVYEMVTLR